MMTPFGELTRLGSQVEISETPESWTDPIIITSPKSFHIEMIAGIFPGKVIIVDHGK